MAAERIPMRKRLAIVGTLLTLPIAGAVADVMALNERRKQLTTLGQRVTAAQERNFTPKTLAAITADAKTVTPSVIPEVQHNLPELPNQIIFKPTFHPETFALAAIALAQLSNGDAGRETVKKALQTRQLYILGENQTLPKDVAQRAVQPYVVRVPNDVITGAETDTTRDFPLLQAVYSTVVAPNLPNYQPDNSVSRLSTEIVEGAIALVAGSGATTTIPEKRDAATHKPLKSNRRLVVKAFVGVITAGMVFGAENTMTPQPVVTGPVNDFINLEAQTLNGQTASPEIGSSYNSPGPLMQKVLPLVNAQIRGKFISYPLQKPQATPTPTPKHKK